MVVYIKKSIFNLSMKLCVFAFLLIGIGDLVTAQSTSQLVTHLLNKIEQEQLTANSTFFPKGIFPTYRQYDKNKLAVKPDDNIFYNALICYTLKKLTPFFSPAQRQIVDSIYARTLVASTFYKNTKGRSTYNFWKTNPSTKVFPNSGWINWFDKINALPDDVDDTVMMLLATNEDSTEVAKVHQLMQLYTNGNKNVVKNSFAIYEHLPAYSTWFGEKWPIDFDACVLSNVLLMVQHYNLQWTKADSASLQLIVSVINNNQHKTHPAYIFPHYAKTSIFLYHISRLMAEKPIAALESIKPVLIQDALKLLETKIGLQEKILLLTSLQRWGCKSVPSIVLPNDWELQLAESNEAFFIANMASMAKNPYKKIIGKLGIGKFYYYNVAYNYTLFLECLLTY
jgi:hypothetical protein